jgi:hypothetical protein
MNQFPFPTFNAIDHKTSPTLYDATTVQSRFIP